MKASATKCTVRWKEMKMDEQEAEPDYHTADNLVLILDKQAQPVISKLVIHGVTTMLVGIHCD